MVLTVLQEKNILKCFMYDFTFVKQAKTGTKRILSLDQMTKLQHSDKFGK